MNLTEFRLDDEPIAFVLRPVACPHKDKRVLSVDQTLGASGWAILQWNLTLDRLSVCETGMVSTTSDLTAHEGNFDQSDQIFVQFYDLLGAVLPDVIVHEYPPISRPGLKMRRPESSLLAADALRHAAIIRGIPIAKMVPAQRTKTRFTGNPKATKADIKVAVEALDPSTKSMSPMNENVRDAIANGWLAMEGDLP